MCVSLTQAQEACGPLEIDNALTMVRGLERDMQEAKVSAAEGKLRPLPGETVSERYRVCVCTCICRFFTICQSLDTPASNTCPACMQTPSVLLKIHALIHLMQLRECPQLAQLEIRPRWF